MSLHNSNISQSETWRMEDNPHEVSGQLTVDSSATLTLNPGVVVRFDADSQLTVSSGTLLASGTTEAPIFLGANGTGGPGSWRGLVLATAGSGSVLEYVRLSDCGASTGEGACLSVRGKATPVLHDVGVGDSASVGVNVADDGSAFDARSDILSINRSAGLAVHLGANQGDSLPGHLLLSGNTPDAVGLSGNISRTLTWPSPGYPLLVNGAVAVDAADAASVASLTIAAGTQLRFKSDAELIVGYSGHPSSLVVSGTSKAPVLFTADPASKGPWHGVQLLVSSKTPTSTISFATFELAGLKSSINAGTGNLNIDGDYHLCDVNHCPVLTDVVFQKSSGPGLMMLNGAGLGATSARLSFQDNARYAVSAPTNSAGSIPAESAFINNTPNAVELTRETSP